MNTTARKKTHRLYKRVVCPFCSLLCDDLNVKSDNGLSVVDSPCPKASRGFEQEIPVVQPQINGKNVSLDEAIKHASKLIKQAKHPLISGMGSDVAGSRAAMLLAETSRGIIDHQSGDAMVRNILVLQSQGWIMTTLAELKNRADFVLFIGTDTRNDYPRFFERFIYNQSTLFLKKKPNRNIAFIGNSLKANRDNAESTEKTLTIPCPSADLGDYVSTLHGLIKDRRIPARTISPAKLSGLKKIADQLKSSTYSVIVWSPASMDFPHAELTVQAICEIIRELNQTTRSAGLSLSGDNGAGSFMNVCSWQSGYPLRVSYAGGFPAYDPYNFSTAKLIKSDGVDLLFWVSSFLETTDIPECNIPRIVLARPSTKQVINADVVIPVGTPGIDHDGNLFRTDSVVSLPLKKLRASKYPSVADVITGITQEL